MRDDDMTEPYEYLVVEKSARIALITLQRPEKLNALNAGTITELDRAMRNAAADSDIGGVIVTGAGKAFVAGADIAELVEMGPLTGIRVSRQGQDTFRFIERMPKPVIA